MFPTIRKTNPRNEVSGGAVPIIILENPYQRLVRIIRGCSDTETGRIMMKNITNTAFLLGFKDYSEFFEKKNLDMNQNRDDYFWAEYPDVYIKRMCMVKDTEILSRRDMICYLNFYS